MARIVKRSLFVLAALALVVGLAALALVSCATVETTARGAPTRLRVPFLVGDAAFPVFVGDRDGVVLPGFLDGPIVRRDGDGAWSATWFCEDRVHRARGTAPALRIECAGRRHDFELADPAVPAAVGPMPARLVVLSDLEGNLAFLERALLRLGVVGAAGDWVYGAGQLVVLGDSVDRGRDVFGVLWRLHDLAAQAQRAGGAVHVVLGNHEQYMLRTNPSRAHPEHIYALNRMGGYARAFAQDTVIGHWLRQQPVALKLGSVLFVHGGIGPQVAGTGLSIEQLNAAMRGYWTRPVGTQARSAPLDAVLAPTGVTQYRGYFRAMEGRYPQATDAEVTRVLRQFQAGTIVVAHTLVEKIRRLHGSRVIAVDVNNDEARAEVLTFVDGHARIVDLGIPRDLRHDDGRMLREFGLGDATDRRLLTRAYRDTRRLVTLPYPY